MRRQHLSLTLSHSLPDHPHLGACPERRLIPRRHQPVRSVRTGTPPPPQLRIRLRDPGLVGSARATSTRSKRQGRGSSSIPTTLEDF